MIASTKPPARESGDRDDANVVSLWPGIFCWAESKSITFQRPRDSDRLHGETAEYAARTGERSLREWMKGNPY